MAKLAVPAKALLRICQKKSAGPLARYTLERSQRRIIIWELSHFWAIFSVGHFVVFINDDDGPLQQPPFFDGQAVCVAKLSRHVVRNDFDIAARFLRNPPLLIKRMLSADRQKLDVIMIEGLIVEALRLRMTNAGV